MDFSILESEEFEGMTVNPFAVNENGEWKESHTSIDFLNDKFGHLETAEEMINATESEGLKLYFIWLRDKGILN